MLPLETNLKHIAALAKKRRDDYLAFGHYVDIMWEREARPPAELDALVDSIAADVIAEIDCTTCANCCRSLTVGLTPNDISSLATALHLSEEQVITDHVDRHAAHTCGEWGVLCHQPCPFLRGKLCSLYAHRPGACRHYPALTPNFRWLITDILAGVGNCPIIFNVIERLKIRLGWE
jgi:hypothetical protein